MRYGRISIHLSRHSILLISAEFALFYCFIGLSFSILYWKWCIFNQGNLCFFQSLYFSFIAQLTSGYGDFIPTGCAQTIAVIQGIIGIILGGIWAGAIVAKWLAYGKRSSILFAEWAGYSLEEERFFVLFVNRNADDLVDVNINSIVKLARYNPVPPGVNAPYIGKSAWTFAIQHASLEELAGLKFFNVDGIKISISGTTGMTRYTNWRKYTLDQVYVLPNRDYFWNDIFENPRFDKVFSENFKRPCTDNYGRFCDFDFKAELKIRRKNKIRARVKYFGKTNA